MSSHADVWYGWARVAGEWQQVSGPTPGLVAAGRALDDELARRRLTVRNRDMVLTGGEPPRTTTANVRT